MVQHTERGTTERDERQPSDSHDLFVSYSRADREFVRGLVDILAARGKRAWVDLEDIPPSAAWMAEIEEAITSADGYLVVVSPDFARSTVCAQELEHAREAGKRIVPVLVRPTEPQTVPPFLAALNWIDASDTERLERAADAVVTALETDLDHVKAHTRLLVRASEWRTRGEDRSLLLRGRDLAEAEATLATDHEPRATDLQTRFVLASSKASARRQRTGVAIAVCVALVAASLGIAAWIQRGAAVRNEHEAVARAAESRSRELASASIGQLETDPELSVLLATQAVDAAQTPEAISSLRQAIAGSHVRTVFRGHTAPVADAEFSPDGAKLVTAGRDGNAIIWDTSSGAQVVTLSGHTDNVEDADFNPDGTRVVTASFDGTARIWDATSGEQIAVLKGQDAAVYAAAFSPDASRMVTAGGDGTARVWNARSGAPLAVLRGDDRPIYDASFSPDGHLIATASDDGTARLWRTSDGHLITVLRGHTDGVYMVAFDPNGQRVVTASEDGTARIWSVPSGRPLAKLASGQGALDIARFSPDGRSIVTAGDPAEARVWDAETGRLIHVLRGHRARIDDASFSPDGTMIVTASLDGAARVWDAGSGDLITVLRGHDGEILSSVFSPDSRSVVTAGVDGTARLWDPSSAGSSLPGIEGFVVKATLSPDGRLAAAVGDDGLFLWNVQSGKLLQRLGTSDGPFFVVAFSRDGELVAAGGASGTGYVWKTADGSPVATLSGHSGQLIFPDGIAFSPDGGRIVTSSIDGTARIWDATTGESLDVLKGHVGLVKAATFSPDGRLVATAGKDGTARIWDAATGQEMKVLRGHVDQVNSVAFDPTGQTILTSSGDRTARIWDVGSGETQVVLRGHTAAVSGAMFDGEGRRVLTWSEDGTARIWDAGTGTQLQILTPGGNVTSATWGADSSLVVTTGADGIVRVWDPTKGAQLAIFTEHNDQTWSAAMSPGGQTVLSASDDGTVRLHNCETCGPVDELLTLAATRVTRELTPAERAQYLGEEPPLASSPQPTAGSSPDASGVSELGTGFLDPGRYTMTTAAGQISFALSAGWQATDFQGQDASSTRVAEGVQLLRQHNPARGITILAPRRFVDGFKEWDEDHNIMPVFDVVQYFEHQPELRASHPVDVVVDGVRGSRLDTRFRVSPEIRRNPWPACGPVCAPIIPVYVAHDDGPIGDSDPIVASGEGGVDRWIVLPTKAGDVVIDIYAPNNQVRDFFPEAMKVIDSMSIEPAQ